MQGWRVQKEAGFCTAYDIWMKPLAGGDVAVVMWFRGVCGTHAEVAFTWDKVELPAAKAMVVRDLFERKNLGTFTGRFAGYVNPGGVRMLRLTAA